MEDQDGSLQNAAKELEQYLLFAKSAKLQPIDYEGSYMQKLNAVRKYYQAFLPKLEEYNKKYPNRLYNAYPFQWHKVFTPIEWAAWEVLRIKGDIPLYPQYPAGGYIIDFADPFRKVGLELDGKDWHKQDRDIIRDVELGKLGWRIYRVPGKEMLRTRFSDWADVEILYNDFNERYLSEADREKIRYWIKETGDGVIEAIKQVFYTEQPNDMDDLDAKFYNLCQRSLIEHKLID